MPVNQHPPGWEPGQDVRNMIERHQKRGEPQEHHAAPLWMQVVAVAFIAAGLVLLAMPVVLVIERIIE